VRLLGGGELARLRQRLRRHFERHRGYLSGALQLNNLAPIEQEALALLMGRRPRLARSIRIHIEQLDGSLRAAGVADSLRAALEMLDGPIEDRAGLRQARLLRWAQVLGSERWHPVLRLGLQTPTAAASLKRLAHGEHSAAEQLLEQASRVMQRLPAAGITRAQLAAETLGNAHALDNGYPTATIVLSALRQESRPDDASATDEQNSETARALERAREIWARVGVLVNELARPALCLNLPLRSPVLIGGSSGEPQYLSLRTLLRVAPAWHIDGTPIYVCENPNIVAIAADQLGPRCASLVCTEGMPAAAQRTLLTQLTQAGARLLYHGDFDWAGLRIANFVMRTWPALPWRFTTADYEAAVAHATHRLHSVGDVPVSASWDNSLTAAMKSCGQAIAEEAIVAGLLEDLAL
jgi:uncharacterized protein (TIGR02679 family)